MNRISEFADSFVPKNLSKKRKNALKQEIICHVLDKADYYQELGYTEEESISKATEDFGTDEDMKKNILSEFEELYSEKTIFGLLAGLLIFIMNWLCFPLDIWVASADFNRDPDPAGTFASFFMIFIVLALIVFARIKKYRKMLLCIGISNILVLGILLWCFYPQMAGQAMAYNLAYLIDRFTPLLLGKENIVSSFMLVIAWCGIPLIFALYSVVASVLLKTGRIYDVKNPRKKCIITGAVFAAVTLITCMLQPTGQRYIDDYPVWINAYDMYISEETEDLYGRIKTGDSFQTAEKILISEGFRSFEEYRGHLDKLTKKQFDADIADLTFAEGYTIYFHPEKYIKGQGLVGIREKDGIVTGVAIGNVSRYMYDSKNQTFGYANTYIWSRWDDINEVKEYFSLLNTGDDEYGVMLPFGTYYGEIYSKRKYTENGRDKTYYRIHFYGLMHSEKKHEYERNDSCYIELTFLDGKLENGALYTDTYEDGERNIYMDEISP